MKLPLVATDISLLLCRRASVIEKTTTDKNKNKNRILTTASLFLTIITRSKL